MKPYQVEYRNSMQRIKEFEERQEKLLLDLELLQRAMLRTRSRISVATNNLSIIFKHYKP